MPVKVLCPNPKCDASFGVDESELGHAVRCKTCGFEFVAGDEASNRTLAPSNPGDSHPSGSSSGGLPSTIGRYRIIRKLGQGGMGAVYLARDEELCRDVALKVPTLSEVGDNAEMLQRFRREARAAASFRHPNFCPIHESGTFGDRPYLVMPYVEGKPLTSRVDRERPMDPREAAELVRLLALAMAEAHKLGILHRDLKPANVMIDERGQPIVMDFGLARMVATDDPDLTGSNALLGTVSYMSPEQVQNDKALLGPATDVYSLGVILYELVAGRKPFEGAPYTVIGMILMSEMPSPAQHRPGLDPELVGIIRKATAKAVGDRYRSMTEFAGALGGWLGVAEDRRGSKAKSGRGGVRAFIALATTAVLIALGATAYVATDSGTLKIEGFDPTMEVQIDGRDVRIEGAGKSIALRTGEHGLTITHGDTVVKSPKTFEVTRGKETVVRVGFTPSVAVAPRPPEVATAPPPPMPGTVPAPSMPDQTPTSPPGGDKGPPVAPPMPNGNVAVGEADAGNVTTPMPIPPQMADPSKAKSKTGSMRTAESTKRSSAGEDGTKGDLVPSKRSASRDASTKKAAPSTRKAAPIVRPDGPFGGVRAGELAGVEVGEIKIYMQWCPSGLSTLGSPTGESGRGDDEKMVEVAFTKGFWAFKTEVKQELYEKIMGDNPSEFQGPRRPVENVKYADAVEFAEKLTRRLHESGSLPGDWAIQLPTEAQWEYAARAGTRTAFPFGNSVNSNQANFNGLTNPYEGAAKGPFLKQTTYVGSYDANPWGLCDTIGNVAEWCVGDSNEKPGEKAHDPGEPVYGIIRGGSWNYVGAYCRSSARMKFRLDLGSDSVGFRPIAIRTGPG